MHFVLSPRVSDLLVNISNWAHYTTQQEQSFLNHLRAEELMASPKQAGPACRYESAFYTPTNSALYFIHTDFVAKLLITGSWFNAPCKPTDGCEGNCKLAVASFIQDKVGADCGRIVGAYLQGKGYPGDVYIVLFDCELHYCSASEYR